MYTVIIIQMISHIRIVRGEDLINWEFKLKESLKKTLFNFAPQLENKIKAHGEMVSPISPWQSIAELELEVMTKSVLLSDK